MIRLRWANLGLLKQWKTVGTMTASFDLAEKANGLTPSADPEGFHGRFSNRSKQRTSAPPCRITRYSPSPPISFISSGDHSGEGGSLPADAPVPRLHPTFISLSLMRQPISAIHLDSGHPTAGFCFCLLSANCTEGLRRTHSLHALSLLQLPQRCTEEAGGVSRHGNAVIDWLVMQHSCKQEMAGWPRIGWRHTPQPPSPVTVGVQIIIHM